jgi:hypothetical protein
VKLARNATIRVDMGRASNDKKDVVGMITILVPNNVKVTKEEVQPLVNLLEQTLNKLGG